MSSPIPRTRADRCPGVLRPWPAEDGALVRIRVPGGRVTTTALRALAEIAERYGDGRLRVTSRANLQLRALPSVDGVLPPEVVAAIAATGLLPSRGHDTVRNVLVSPATGVAGGRADLRPVTVALDRGLVADGRLAGLPGRFLFTLDDGRGDLADRHRDLGLVALDARRAQLRVGSAYGEVVALPDAATTLLALARGFLAARGTGAEAAWHVGELAAPLVPPVAPEPGAGVRTGPLPFEPVPGGRHHPVGEDGIDATTLASWPTDHVVLTPWHGVLVPEEAR